MESATALGEREMAQLRDGIPESCLHALRSQSAVLMVGAGSSVFARMPTWSELLGMLKSEFSLPASGQTDSDLIAAAEGIVDAIREAKREPEYYKFLDRTFRPQRDAPTHHRFHEILVSLGFAGILTTNYDHVLECAVTRAFSNGVTHSCMPIDLCDPDEAHRYRISEFLHDLPKKDNPRRILHVHGHWESPESIILTRADYEAAYGPLHEETGGSQGNRVPFHRSVISAIVAIHPLVFVGFSMSDPFFMRLVEDVRKCYRQDGDRIHYALLPKYDEERASELLSRYCVEPFYYYVPDSRQQDHSALKDFVAELGQRLGVSPRAPHPLLGAGIPHGDRTSAPTASRLRGAMGAIARALAWPFRRRTEAPDVCSVTKEMLER